MNKCRTCVYWRVYEGDNPMMGGLGQCKKIPELHRAWNWNKDFNEYVNQTDSLAFTEDGSSYYSGLVCYGDFGCVMHKEIAE